MMASYQEIETAASRDDSELHLELQGYDKTSSTLPLWSKLQPIALPQYPSPPFQPTSSRWSLRSMDRWLAGRERPAAVVRRVCRRLQSDIPYEPNLPLTRFLQP